MIVVVSFLFISDFTATEDAILFFVLDVKLESFRSDNDFLEGIDTLGTDTINHHVIPQLLPSSDGAGTLQFASSDLYLRCEIHE